MLTSSFDPNYTFTSEAANLEYSILSAILGNPSPPDSATTPPPDLQYPRWSSESIDLTTNLSPPYADSQMSLQQSDSGLPNANGNSTHYLTYPFPPGQPASPTELAYSASYSPQTSAVQPLQGRYPAEHQSRSPITSMHLSASKDAQACGLFLLLSFTISPTSVSVSGAVSDMPASKWQSINDRVTTPYDYTEGYHFLMKHLPTRYVFAVKKIHCTLTCLLAPNRFEKNDILRIVRALAIFRPSLIALQMPLSLNDEIFVEKCFQRSLLVRFKIPLFFSILKIPVSQELEKLISYSGTPTVVWRRTGEICLVAPEFSMLTEWPLEELVGNGPKKYIYEVKFKNGLLNTFSHLKPFHSYSRTNPLLSIGKTLLLMHLRIQRNPCTRIAFC